MAKRVSMQGRGAEIFFGDYAPSAGTPGTAAVKHSPTPPTSAARAEPQPTPPPSEPAQATKQASVQAPSRASRVATKRAGNDAGMQEGKEAGEESLGIVPDMDRVEQQLARQGTLTNSFRYTPGELSALTDVIYDVNKRHHTKLSKQDAARVGLDVVLKDYRERGDRSLLGQLALRRKRRRGGGL